MHILLVDDEALARQRLRTLLADGFLAGVRAELPLLLGVVPFGMIFGVLGLAAGLPGWAVVLSSSLIFGGSSQVVFAQLWGAGALPAVSVATVGVVNLRHLLYSAAVAEYLSGYPDILQIKDIPRPVIHQSVDPDVVIVEFEATGTVIATGAPYRMTYIAVITTRNGEIQSYRDYWSPAAAAEVMGGAQELLNAFPGSTHE